MGQAGHPRYLAPMTMAEILRPQVNEESEEQRKAFRKSRGRRRRFIIFVVLSFIYASSGISFATIVPAVLKQIASVASGKNSGNRGDGSDALFADDAEAGPGGGSAGGPMASSDETSSSRSSGSSSNSGGGGANAVPEPSSVILLGIGCAALGGEALRRKLARRAA